MTHAKYCGQRRSGTVVSPFQEGRSLALIRQILGVRADDLARTANLSSFSLSRLENGRRRPGAGEIGRLVHVVGDLVDQPGS